MEIRVIEKMFLKILIYQDVVITKKILSWKLFEEFFTSKC